MSAFGPDGADQTTADRDERRCIIRDWWSKYRSSTGEPKLTDAQIYVAMLTWASEGGEAVRQAIIDGTIS